MKKFLLFTLSMLAVSILGSYAQSENLVSHWKFDETSGTTVNDVITGATGEIQGEGTQWTSGVNGGAIDFASTAGSTLILVEDSEALNPINFTDQSFSVAVWVKVDPSPAVEQTILIKGSVNADTPNGNGQRFQLATKNNNIYWSIDDDATKTQLSYPVEVDYPVNQWAHYVGVRNTVDDFLYFYLNGVKVSSLLDDTGALNMNGQALVIGNFHTLESQFYGSLDDLRIYNKALTDEEVLALYTNSTAVHEIIIADVKAYGVVGGIKLPPDSKASVYTITGKIIAQNINDDFVSCPNGMYIVKIGNVASKVMVTQ